MLQITRADRHECGAIRRTRRFTAWNQQVGGTRIMGYTGRTMRYAALFGLVPLVWAAASAAGASTATKSSTIRLHAHMTAGQQKPAQVVRAPRATGDFSGTLVIKKDQG